MHIARDLEIPDNIVLLFQPPHSLELNSIERLWLDLKIDLRGMMFSNFDELQINDESDSRIDDTRMDCFIDESSFHIEDSI